MEADKTTTVSLLDYFAAHAPAVPHWFKHQNPDKEPRIPSNFLSFRDNYKHGAILKRYYNEEHEEDDIIKSFSRLFFLKVSESIQKEILEYLRRRDCECDSYSTIKPLWEQKDKMLRITQWRFAYAKAMIAEKNK